MLVKAISDNNLQALARAILLYIPKEVGTYYDIACKQRSDNDGVSNVAIMMDNTRITASLLFV